LAPAPPLVEDHQVMVFNQSATCLLVDYEA
jgi:hypothetical protein